MKIKIIIFVVLLLEIMECFFISSRDLRRIFNFTPPRPSLAPNRDYIRRHPPHPSKYQEHDGDYNEDYNYYHKDRNDNNRTPNYPVKYKERPSCEEGHYHKHNNKYTKDLPVRNYHYPKKNEYYDNDNRDSAEETFNYRDRRHRINYQDNDDIEDKRHEREKYKKHNLKKDYVSGVLVTIPKIKDDDKVNDYFNSAKKSNPFFEAFLKTDEAETQGLSDGHLHYQPYEDFKFF